MGNEDITFTQKGAHMEKQTSLYEDIIVIGDVHGCYDKLCTLLSILPHNARLIFLGDLIHKGPDSKRVVDAVRALVNIGKATCIRGNHEDMAGKGEWKDQENGLTEEDRKWLMDRPLFVRATSKGNIDYLCLHAGIDQGSAKAVLTELIDNRQLPELGPWSAEMVKQALSTLNKKKLRALERVRFIRYINPLGHIVAFGSEKEEDTWWADSYDGCFGHIIYGHQPNTEPQYFDHATCIDTEAYAGGDLTAISLNTGDLYTA